MITSNAAHEGINRLRQKRIPMFQHEVSYQLFVMYVDIIWNTRSESILAPKKTISGIPLRMAPPLASFRS